MALQESCRPPHTPQCSQDKSILPCIFYADTKYMIICSTWVPLDVALRRAPGNNRRKNIGRKDQHGPLCASKNNNTCTTVSGHHLRAPHRVYPLIYRTIPASPPGFQTTPTESQEQDFLLPPHCYWQGHRRRKTPCSIYAF